MSLELDRSGRRPTSDRRRQSSAMMRVVLFCSLAVLDPRAGHTMGVLSPFISVLRYSD